MVRNLWKKSNVRGASMWRKGAGHFRESPTFPGGESERVDRTGWIPPPPGKGLRGAPDPPMPG